MPRIEIQTRIKAPIEVVFDLTSPLGVLGRVLDHLILIRYMTQLLEERNSMLKALAESGADMK